MQISVAVSGIRPKLIPLFAQSIFRLLQRGWANVSLDFDV